MTDRTLTTEIRRRLMGALELEGIHTDQMRTVEYTVNKIVPTVLEILREEVAAATRKAKRT